MQVHWLCIRPTPGRLSGEWLRRLEPGLMQHRDKGHRVFREVPGKAGDFGLLTAECGEVGVRTGRRRDGGLAAQTPAVRLAGRGPRPPGAWLSFPGAGATPWPVCVLLSGRRGGQGAFLGSARSRFSPAQGGPSAAVTLVAGAAGLRDSHSYCGPPVLRFSSLTYCLLLPTLFPHLNLSHLQIRESYMCVCPPYRPQVPRAPLAYRSLKLISVIILLLLNTVDWLILCVCVAGPRPNTSLSVTVKGFFG